MNRTDIEWVINPDGSKGYTWNPITGCKNNCWYCYAKKISERYGNSFEPTYHPERYDEVCTIKKARTIFVGSMCDMWGDWIDINEIKKIKVNNRNIYLYLTKNPKGYEKYCIYYTDNSWYGMTIDDFNNATNILNIWNFVELLNRNNMNSFISLDPLLKIDEPSIRLYSKLFTLVDWIIIGTLNINGKPQNTVNFPEVINWLKPYHDKLFIKDSIYKLYPDLKKFRYLPYLEGK